jgi:hypothetical protein
VRCRWLRPVLHVNPTIPATGTLSSTPSWTPSPTAQSQTLVITQLGVTTQVPSGLAGVTYKVEDASQFGDQNASGSNVLPVAAFGISSSAWSAAIPASYACGVAIPAGSPEAELTVWTVDPGTLTGQGDPSPGVTPHVGNRYFKVEGAGPSGGPNSCGNGQPYSPTAAQTLEEQQLSLLEQMVQSVAAS